MPGEREFARRRIVNLTLLIFWLLIFEGAIRKWVAPQYSTYLYFLRDPFALYTYFYALRTGLFTPAPLALRTALLLAALVGLASIVNLLSVSSYTVILALYGLRNYFLYVPLAFLIARCFQVDDLFCLLRHSVLAMCIATPLALIQFTASPTAAINVGIGTDPELHFDNLTSGSGHVRPPGTFTSVVGMSQLTASTAALLLWAWSYSGAYRPPSRLLVAVGGLAVAAALAVSGSRTSFVLVGVVVVAGIAVAPFLRKTSSKLKGVLIPTTIVVAFAVLFPLVFHEAYQAFVDRWTDAAATEGQRFQLGWIGRALYGYYDFLRLLDQVPLLGYGAGSAGNGAVTMGLTINGVSVLKIAEEDWSRHVIDLGPVLALMLIAYRISFGVWLLRRSLRSALAASDPLPLLLFAYCGPALIQGQIASHGLVNGFGWLYVGFCMAAGNAFSIVSASNPAAGAMRALPAAAPAAPRSAPFPNLLR
jgi:hypothetical protein